MFSVPSGKTSATTLNRFSSKSVKTCEVAAPAAVYCTILGTERDASLGANFIASFGTALTNAPVPAMYGTIDATVPIAVSGALIFPVNGSMSLELSRYPNPARRLSSFCLDRLPISSSPKASPGK